MITICCLWRNGSRAPSHWWGYSRPDWRHVYCKVPQLTIWEKQQHTPSSNHQNKGPKIKLGEQGTHMSTMDLRQCAETAASHSLCEGMYLFVAQCLGFQPLPPVPWPIAVQGSSSASSLQPQVKPFPWESMETKCALADIPEVCLVSCKTAGHSWAGLTVYVYLYVYIYLDVHTNI